MNNTMPSELGLILKAVQFAADKHRNQRRKDAEASPYINHPIALASVLFHEGGVSDAVVLCAALLHDTIEDTDTTLHELAYVFGPEIADIVMEVTDDKRLPKDVRKQLQIEHAPSVSFRAKLVKLADKVCNLRDITVSPPAYWSDARKAEYYAWSRQVVDGLRGANEALEAKFDELYDAHVRKGR